jgi:hypothetical protein
LESDGTSSTSYLLLGEDEEDSELVESSLLPESLLLFRPAAFALFLLFSADLIQMAAISGLANWKFTGRGLT